MQSSPWIMLIGGGALLNVSLFIWGTKAPTWVRYPGAALCVAAGLTCIGISLAKYFQKKPERPKVALKHVREVELPPETAAKLRTPAVAAGKKKSGQPAPPSKKGAA